MNNLVCLDTSVIIWGIKRESRPGQQEMIPRTERFLKKLEETGAKIMIPSVVLTEAILPIPKIKHQNFLSDIHKRLMVFPYDAYVSTITAEIWYDKYKELHIKDIDEGTMVPRDHLKIDCMIVATAICADAVTIYSHDPHIKRIANGRIDVQEIPLIPEQPVLF